MIAINTEVKTTKAFTRNGKRYPKGKIGKIINVYKDNSILIKFPDLYEELVFKPNEYQKI